MASLAELRICCDDLDINSSKMSKAEMESAIREKVDELYAKTKHAYRGIKWKLPTKDFSETLLKFLTMEYDYIIEDKDGNKLDYKFRPLEESR